MRLPIAFVLTAALAACHPPKKQDPYATRADDVPTQRTCCVAVDAAGTPTYALVVVEQCPEEHRNSVDTCDIGPGDTRGK